MGRTQTGQPGPWIISTFGGQEIHDAVAPDRVGVAHRRTPSDGRLRSGRASRAISVASDRTRQRAVPIFVDVFHLQRRPFTRRSDGVQQFDRLSDASSGSILASA